MKKLLIKLLIFTMIYSVCSNATRAEIETTPIKPISMFKAKVVPCDGTNKGTNGFFYCKSDLLQKALKFAFCADNLSEAMAKMNCSSNFYYAQNNTPIKNGTYDVHQLFKINDICNAKKIKITITLATEECFKKYQKPAITMSLYKDINQCKLGKKFESKAFMHHYLMKKYEVPFCKVSKQPTQGLQKFVAIIDVSKIKCSNEPLTATVTYMDGGFKKRMHRSEPKVKYYAYIIEVEKLS